MALVSRWQPRGELSPRAFDAEVRSLVQRAALEELARRIATTGPIAVRHTRYTPISGRVCFELSDDSTLKLRLYWRRRGQVDRLDSIRCDDRIGWIASATCAGFSERGVGSPISLRRLRGRNRQSARRGRARCRQA